MKIAAINLLYRNVKFLLLYLFLNDESVSFCSLNSTKTKRKLSSIFRCIQNDKLVV